MIVSGRNVSVSAAANEGRRRTLEAQVTDTIKRWAVAFPNQVAGIKRQTQFLRETSWNGRGGSRNGHIALQGQIPTTLYKMMAAEYGRSWLDDWNLKRTFWSLFKVGVVAKNSLMGDRW